MSASEIYRNAQWVVTSDGVEAVDGSYFIARDRLLDMRNGTYAWPQHVAGKTWVDARDFIVAFDVALRRLTDGHDEALMLDCVERVYVRLMDSTRFDVMNERLFPTNPKQTFQMIPAGRLDAVANGLTLEAGRTYGRRTSPSFTATENAQ